VGPAWLYRPRPNWPGGCEEADEEAIMKKEKTDNIHVSM